MIPVWDTRVGPWVSLQIWGRANGFENYTSLGVIRSDKLVAGVVFHNMDPEAGLIEVSAAATDRRWMTRRVVTTAFSYVFDGCGCQMATARHSANNPEPRRIWSALGATEIIIPRLYGRNEDGAFASLTEEAWRKSRFNEVEHGQK